MQRRDDLRAWCVYEGQLHRLRAHLGVPLEHIFLCVVCEPTEPTLLLPIQAQGYVCKVGP